MGHLGITPLFYGALGVLKIISGYVETFSGRA